MARLRPGLQLAAPALLPRVEHLVQTLNSGIALKRRIIEDLRPSSLDNLGLVPALEILCSDPKAYSGSLTAIIMPEGHDADAFRKVALENFNLSLGQGLTKVAGKVFRIGHLGDFNDLMLMGTLSGVEMALGLAKVPHKTGGAQAALTYLRDTAPGARRD